MSEDLTGKTVVITGASRGIGYGVAKGFAAAGARLTLIADDPKTETAAGEIGAAIRAAFAKRDEGADRNAWLYSYNPLTVPLV